MADHPDIEALNARADECWSQIQKFMTRRGAIQTRRDDLDERRTRLLELQERLSPAFVSEPLTELLHRYAARRAGRRWSCSTPNRTARRCSPRSAANASNCARAAGAPTTNSPASSTRSTPSFPDAIPNDSDDFDERVHDYVALCRHIDERELPEAYERMMRLVTEQAPDAILTLHRVAEQETRRISEQIDRVNTGSGRGGVQPRHPADAARHAAQPDRGRRAHRDRAVHLAAHRRGRAGRQAGDPRPVRRHPAAAQPAGVHRAGGQGVDARRARRAQPVHLRLRRMGRQHRGADPHAQQCRRQLRRRAGEADGVLPRGRAELQPGQPRKCATTDRFSRS